MTKERTDKGHGGEPRSNETHGDNARSNEDRAAEPHSDGNRAAPGARVPLCPSRALGLGYVTVSKGGAVVVVEESVEGGVRMSTVSSGSRLTSACPVRWCTLSGWYLLRLQ